MGCLVRFKGVGPKTVACVMMFCLARDEFPVDTHVWRISKNLGWVPAKANREDTYRHMNIRVPADIRCFTCGAVLCSSNLSMVHLSRGACYLRESWLGTSQSKQGEHLPPHQHQILSRHQIRPSATLCSEPDPVSPLEGCSAYGMSLIGSL